MGGNEEADARGVGTYAACIFGYLGTLLISPDSYGIRNHGHAASLSSSLVGSPKLPEVVYVRPFVHSP